MRKTLLIAAAALLLGTVGTTFAQSTTAQHGIHVNIPAVAWIRIVDNKGNDATGNAMVNFDISKLTNFATNGYTGTFDDKSNAWSSSAFNDIEVLSNAAWNVTVSTTSATETLPDGSTTLTGSNSDINGSNFKVTPTNTSIGAFQLPDAGNAAVSVTSGTRTAGWESLGINGGDYALTLAGTEAAGTYDLVVEYTVSTP